MNSRERFEHRYRQIEGILYLLMYRNSPAYRQVVRAIEVLMCRSSGPACLVDGQRQASRRKNSDDDVLEVIHDKIGLLVPDSGLQEFTGMIGANCKSCSTCPPSCGET